MADEVDEDVDPVAADESLDLVVAAAEDRTPVVRQLAELRGDGVFTFQIGIGDEVESAAVAVVEDRGV